MYPVSEFSKEEVGLVNGELGQRNTQPDPNVELTTSLSHNHFVGRSSRQQYFMAQFPSTALYD